MFDRRWNDKTLLSVDCTFTEHLLQFMSLVLLTSYAVSFLNL